MSALQKGETVLITGATGWVGSHIAHEALAAGLKIKLAVRDESKAKPTVQALEKIHGQGLISTVIIKDFTKDSAFDEAVKGVQGIIHAASDVSFSDKPEEVVTPVLKAYNSFLNSANSQKSIRRFVFTSSSIAFADLSTSEPSRHFTTQSWNDEAVEAIKVKPDAVSVYAASKVLSEKAAWEFLSKEKPNFTITSINPSLVLGAPVPELPIQSTGAWFLDAAEGKDSIVENFAPLHHIDVDDTAKLHVIALINEDVKNERIFAVGTKSSFNHLLDLINKYRPNAPTKARTEAWAREPSHTVDTARASHLLKDQGGLKDLEYSVKGNLQAA